MKTQISKKKAQASSGVAAIELGESGGDGSIGFSATAIAGANGKLEGFWQAPSSLPGVCSDWSQAGPPLHWNQTCLLSARYRNLKLNQFRP